MVLRARMRLALSQEKIRADIITPIKTANARLCRTAVTKVTKTITITSDFGILLKVRILAHSKVPSETMIINPVNAAIGTASIKLEPNITNTNSITEATIPDKRALAPLEMLMRDCPIMAQPPIPENNPESTFANPWAIASLFPRPRVSVISSTMLRVNKLSINPTPATIAE